MLKNYFKTALRGIKRHKFFTLINVIGLSIGISSALVIYLIVRYDLSFDKDYQDVNRIYRVVTDFSFSGEKIYNGGVTAPLGNVIATEVSGIESIAPVYSLDGINVNIPAQSSRAEQSRFKNKRTVTLADERYFKMFNYRWLAGSAGTAFKEPYQVVLTSAQAKVYFPQLNYDQMLGRQIVYEDSLKTTVSGIIETPKQNTDLIFTDFVSMSSAAKGRQFAGMAPLEEWENTTSASILFVKTAVGTNISTLAHKIDQAFIRHHPPKPEDAGSTQNFHLEPLSEMHFDTVYGNFDMNTPANRNTLYGLLAIACFLLVLGCINFINLTTAQASQRAKEIGIRKTMGSTRRQLVGQFLSETMLVTLIAALISIVLCPFVLKLFADFILPNIKFDLLSKPSLWLFMLTLTLTVGLVAGIYPALVLSGYQPVQVLKNQMHHGASKTRKAWLRKTLTVTQFIIAQFFIMATVLVSKQIYYAVHKDLGFKKDAILYIETPYKNNSLARRQVFENKLRNLPQVAMVSLSGDAPSANSTQSTTVTYADGKKEIKTNLQLKSADATYMNLYDIKMLAGRKLAAADTGLRYIVINNTYAKTLGFRTPANAIGHYVQMNWGSQTKAEIIGVTRDFYQRSLHEAIKPLAFISGKQSRNIMVHVALKPQAVGSNEWKTAISSMELAWKQLYPDDEFKYQFYDDSIAKYYKREQQTSQLLMWATGLSVLISCLGLLGLAMYTTSLRTKEIGVRKVMGATVAQVVMLLSQEMVLLVALAFLVVAPVAWYVMNQWMQNFVDRTPISWWIFALSGGGMLLTALLTLSFQTIKAAVANPVNSLRSE